MNPYPKINRTMAELQKGRKPRKRKQKTNGIKETPADKWFSRCIRERAGWKCERCGVQYTPPTGALHCSHVEGRGNWSVRFEPLNALALCYGCHRIIGSSPKGHEKLYKQVMGDEAWEVLGEKSEDHRLGKQFRQTCGKGEIASYFKSEYERMLELRSQGITGRLEFSGWL